MILLLFKKKYLTMIEKDRLAKIMGRVIPMLLYCNRYLRKFREIIDLENKITFK